MTNENKDFNDQNPKTEPQPKSDFHDEFETKDEFGKEKVDFKKLDIKKTLTFVLGGLALLAVIVAGTYAKLQKNKESRAETGIESAISKPVEQTDQNNNSGHDNFGFDRTNPTDPNDTSTNTNTPPEKSAEQLEMEQKLAEQQQQLALQQQQAQQEAIAREQALLNARQKSGILVDSSGGKNNTTSPNGDASALAGIPPELQPYLLSSQAQNSESKTPQNHVNSRVENTTASSMGGRFDSSSTNEKAPIANASYKSDRRLLIQQGKVIDAVLETAIKSDLPSNIIARITNDVYSEQGRNRLLPKGTRLFGQYSSMINDGQTEIGAVWNRAITPNGVEIMLDSPSTNSLGMAGLGGKVNNHYGRIFGTATLLSLIGAGVSNVGVNGNDQNNASQTYRTEVANSFGDQANSILQRNLSIPPTITVKHGSRIKVLVAKDLDFSTIFNQ